jgi:hypothetical protein
MAGIQLNSDAWIVLAVFTVLVLAFLASRRRES